MNNLITEAEFVSFRSISKKVDSEKLNESITLAQASDLQDTLGSFYFDVLTFKDADSYENLLNGCAFVYEGENFIHDGLKSFLADLAYSRYIYNINVNLTPFGAQSKFTNDSTGVDRNTTKDLSKQAQIDGAVKFKIIQKYIFSKPDLFSRYCKGQKSDTGFGRQRISKL